MTRYTIEDLHKLAVNRGGLCLSVSYTGFQKKYMWQCTKGHTFESRFDNVKQNDAWCQQCAIEKRSIAKRKYAIEDMHRLANSMGGKFLSPDFTTLREVYEWECAQGHRFEKKAALVFYRKQWCAICSQKAKLTIEEMQTMARARGGECLSDRYINLNTRLRWKCADGHEFEAMPDNVKHRGSWCPYCNKFIGEDKTRFIFEELLQLPFPKTKRILSGKYELDGLNAQIKLAFEFHGKQHYEVVPNYTHTEDELNKRIAMDKEKAELSSEIGIQLIIIPYWEATDDSHLIGFIKNKLLQLGYDVKERIVDLKKFYERNSALKELKEIAWVKGGECLSDVYLTNTVPMQWKCAEGHVWKAIASSVRRGHWCPACSGLQKGTIEEMREIAASKGGECLSTVYINSYTHLEWRCKEGHTWSATPSSVKHRNWCIVCAGLVKLTIEEMKEIAKRRGGECLSEEYHSKLYLIWKCAKGHIWEADGKAVKHGNWCLECSGKKKKTIETLQLIAENKHGKCLSYMYTNKDTKYLWQCEKGHQWEALMRSAEKVWCKVCKDALIKTKTSTLSQNK